MILTSSANLKDVQAEDYKSISMLFRYLEISSFYNSMDGLLRAKFAYDGVDFRYVISPSGSIPSSLNPMKMSEAQVKASFAMGLKDAQDTINAQTEGVYSIDDLIHYHSLKKSGDESIKNHTYGSFLDAKRNGEFSEYDIMEDPYMNRYTYLTK